MHSSRGLWLGLADVLLVVILSALLSGCDLSTPAPAAGPGLPTETPAPAQPTAQPTEAAPPQATAITLTIWTTEAFSPTEAITTGRIVKDQVLGFETAHPDVRFDFVLKKPYGKGGMLDYLLTTQAVVPELLPDLAFIDVDELRTAVQVGFVQPLNDLLPADVVNDLYPFARQACTLDGRLYGLQLQADLDHLVYDAGQIAVPPSSWPGVLSNEGPYIFPAAGQAGMVNDAFLIQYLAVHPWPPQDGSSQPFLEQDSLLAVLQFYLDGVSRGIFPISILNYPTTDSCWNDYLKGKATITQVSAARYLAERDRTQHSSAAPIPAINGPASAVTRGWALALITPDPAQQAMAAQFLIQLMAPQANADWNKAAGYLPTRQSSLALWGNGDGYAPFIDQQLQKAQPRPPVPGYTQVAAVLQKAVEAVLTGAATPEEAAAQAAADQQ